MRELIESLVAWGRRLRARLRGDARVPAAIRRRAGESNEQRRTPW